MPKHINEQHPLGLATICANHLSLSLLAVPLWPTLPLYPVRKVVSGSLCLQVGSPVLSTALSPTFIISMVVFKMCAPRMCTSLLPAVELAFKTEEEVSNRKSSLAIPFTNICTEIMMDIVKHTLIYRYMHLSVCMHVCMHAHMVEKFTWTK